MTAGNAFFPEAADRYASANAGTLRWMLDRPLLGAGFLNSFQGAFLEISWRLSGLSWNS